MAVLANIENWEERALQLADDCPAGNKHRALSLARDLEQAKVSLTRLAERVDD